MGTSLLLRPGAVGEKCPDRAGSGSAAFVSQKPRFGNIFPAVLTVASGVHALHLRRALVVKSRPMSRIHRSLPPAGTRIGVAFSGGLDTRCAVAWFARSGLEVYSYTADLAQPDEENASDIPPVALQHGA